MDFLNSLTDADLIKLTIILLIGALIFGASLADDKIDPDGGTT